MFQDLVDHYKAGNFKAVIDLYESDPGCVSETAEAILLIVAQSYFKHNQPKRAAPLFLRAARVSEPPKKQLYELAFTLSDDVPEQLEAARGLLALNPRHLQAARFLRHYLPYSLMLGEVAAGNRRAFADLEAGDAFAIACELPWDNVCWCPDEKINAAVFNPEVRGFTPESQAARRGLKPPTGKVRVGYLSNDLSTYHATMVLFRRILDLHDSEAFDIHIFCYTSANLVRIDQGFRAGQKSIVEIGHLDDEAAAALIRSYQLDILVDLKGHTHSSRSNLVNLGVAPVQVAFLGFPGSGTGIDCDYVIGDRIVTPDTSAPYYHEKICRLPECYQPNDNHYRPLPPPVRRRDVGLPEGKIVFGAFNATRKISPQVFDAWMRILVAVPESVLWVMCKDPIARSNFLLHAERRGVGAGRIVFAEGVGQDMHIARLKAVSIGLDTFPCNGHTTTSDKLWAGLPVVTVRGSNFASRVSQSLLETMGVPELVADTVDGYVALAVRLARDPALLEDIRRKLSDNRFRAPLFDSERFTRHLEAAYAVMAQRSRNGEMPDHLEVPALPPREAPFRS